MLFQENAAPVAGRTSVFDTYYEFPGNLTTNLRGSRKFIQLGIAVSTQYDDTVMANVDAHQLALRSKSSLR